MLLKDLLTYLLTYKSFCSSFYFFIFALPVQCIPVTRHLRSLQQTTGGPKIMSRSSYCLSINSYSHFLFLWQRVQL